MNDTMRWFQLTPVDAWFFRDGRPSNMGEDQSDLESIFPPYPATVVGALRAALAMDRGWTGRGPWPQSLHPILGDGFDHLGQLSFHGPLLLKDGGFLFPMPRHVLGDIDERQEVKLFNARVLLRPSTLKVSCDGGELRLPEMPGTAGTSAKFPEPTNAFHVNGAGMEKILAGQLPLPGECIHQDDLFCFERRIGIQRDEHTRTTGEAAMYSPCFVRLRKGVSLAVAIQGLPDDWSLPPIFPLGGESRLATCAPMDTAPVFPAATETTSRTIVLLLTPACFQTECPWWGAGPGDPASRLNHGLQGTVSTSAIDRPVFIGGWDTLRGVPLPMTPMAPPGSVWWIEDVPAIPGNSPLNVGMRTCYGYGLALTGGTAF